MNFNKIKQYIKKEQEKGLHQEKRTVKEMAKQFLILFFLAMFGFSFLSRAADSVMTAKVKTQSIQNQRLHFKISGTAALKEKQATQIALEQGMMIEQVFVAQGAQVKEEDPLFSYQVKDLQGQYEQKSAQLEKLKIEQKKLFLTNTESELKSAKSSEKYAQQDLEQAQENIDITKTAVDAQIEEQYQASKERYNKAKEDKEVALKEAKEQLESAEAKLKELEEKRNEGNTQESLEEITDTQKETVTQAQIEEAIKAVETAKENLSQVKQTVKEVLEKEKQAFEEAKNKRESVKNETYDYTEDLKESNRAVLEAEKSLEQAQISTESATKNEINQKQSTNLSSKGLQLDIDLASKEVLELETLIKAQGIVLAPQNGTMLEMGIKSGAQVAGSEVVSIAINGASLEFEVDKEEAKRLTIGDVVKAQIGERKEWIECVLETIGSEEKEETMVCTAKLPDDAYQIGTSAIFTWEKDSKQYEKCVPLIALREDGYGQTYVLVTKSKESILGKEAEAFRIDVTVLEKDKNVAAIEGGLSYEDEIIVEGNKEIAVGDRVRVEEHE